MIKIFEEKREVNTLIFLIWDFLYHSKKIKKVLFGLSNQPFGVSIKQSIEKLVQTLKTPEIGSLTIQAYY